MDHPQTKPATILKKGPSLKDFGKRTLEHRNGPRMHIHVYTCSRCGLNVY